MDCSELGDDADPAPTYPMNGLLLDEESIYRAMDTKGTGEFVPLSFSAKTGKPLNVKARWPTRPSWAASVTIWTDFSSIWRRICTAAALTLSRSAPAADPLHLL